MANQSQNTPALHRARSILNESRGRELSEGKIEQLTIELAANLLEEANRTMTRKEKAIQAQLARMMEDSKGKVFTMFMTDQCFRSRRYSRIADQMTYLLRKLGIPRYLSWFKRLQLLLFTWFGKAFSFVFVPAAIWTLRKETSAVILPGEKEALKHHMQRRRAEGVRLNINHLGEAILGEEEAKRRLNVYLEDLKRDDIEYVSIKISTIYSQIHLI